MKYLSLFLVLASVASLTNAKYIWGQLNEKSCGDCYKYIKECYGCLDTRTCPPTFPPPFVRCHYKCIEYLTKCEEKFPECFNCYCPNLKEKETCSYKGAVLKNDDCCEKEESLGCSEFYCPDAGKEWECDNKCEDDCLCPNVKKEETCPGEGIYVENKYCCEEKDSDGCSAWKCPGAGEPWECANEC